MAAAPSSPVAPRRPAAAAGEISKRTMVISAIVLVLVLVLGVAIVAVTSDDTGQERRQADGELPAAEAIPQPGSGKSPEEAGDRGGALQLGLFGVMAAGMLFIGVMIFRGGRSAQANRQRWQAAAATGRDGAVAPDRTDDHPPPLPGDAAAAPPPGPAGPSS